MNFKLLLHKHSSKNCFYIYLSLPTAQQNNKRQQSSTTQSETNSSSYFFTYENRACVLKPALLCSNNKNKGAHETHQGSLLNPIYSAAGNFQLLVSYWPNFAPRLSTAIQPTTTTNGLKDFKGKVWTVLLSRYQKSEKLLSVVNIDIFALTDFVENARGRFKNFLGRSYKHMLYVIVMQPNVQGRKLASPGSQAGK